jgi:Cys-tRNA(Pro) deacylase
VAKDSFPVTPAVRCLREHGIAFVPRPYAYVEKGGTRRSAAELGVDEHAVIKTLVMETDARQPLLVLMHGDREVSTRQLARALGARSVAPCSEAAANRLTGYQVGGISPFGTRTPLPVYAERTIFDLPRICINGGRRGFLVELDPRDLGRALTVTCVDAAAG